MIVRISLRSLLRRCSGCCAGGSVGIPFRLSDCCGFGDGRIHCGVRGCNGAGCAGCSDDPRGALGAILGLHRWAGPGNEGSAGAGGCVQLALFGYEARTLGGEHRSDGPDAGNVGLVSGLCARDASPYRVRLHPLPPLRPDCSHRRPKTPTLSCAAGPGPHKAVTKGFCSNVKQRTRFF